MMIICNCFDVVNLHARHSSSRTFRTRDDDASTRSEQTVAKQAHRQDVMTYKVRRPGDFDPVRIEYRCRSRRSRVEQQEVDVNIILEQFVASVASRN